MPSSPNKKPKKSTARKTGSTSTTSKKNTKPTAGAGQTRAKQTDTVPAANEPAAADLRQALRDEESKAAQPATSTPEQEVAKIRESAQRLGIELDEQEALQWLTQMAVSSGAVFSKW